MRPTAFNFWIVWCLVLVQNVLETYCQGVGGFFIDPPPMVNDNDYSNNQVFAFGTPVQVRLQTNLSLFDFLLLQEGNPAMPILHGNVTNTQFVWAASNGKYKLNTRMQSGILIPGNVFYFGVKGDDTFFTSHHFNLTDPATQSARPMIASQTSVMSMSPASLSTSVPATPTQSSLTSAAPTGSPASGGLSTGAIVDVSVGVTLGALAIVGGAVSAFLIRRRRQRRRRQKSLDSIYSSDLSVSKPNEKGLSDLPGQQIRDADLSRDRRLELLGSVNAQEAEPQNRFELQPDEWCAEASPQLFKFF